jgi:hypothetical protein
MLYPPSILVNALSYLLKRKRSIFFPIYHLHAAFEVGL